MPEKRKRTKKKNIYLMKHEDYVKAHELEQRIVKVDEHIKKIEKFISQVDESGETDAMLMVGHCRLYLNVAVVRAFLGFALSKQRQHLCDLNNQFDSI